MNQYLEIDGWSEFQPLRGRGEWIKDSTIQQDKDKLRGLSFFQRGLLQELRRLRGRIGKNIPYDLEYILSATHTTRTDRPHVPHALATLISRGVLVVTDQQLNSAKTHEKEIENEKENREETEAQKPVEVVTLRMPLTVPEPKPKPPSEFTPDDLVFHVLREIGIPARNPELTVLVASAIEAKARLPNWTAEKAAIHMIERGCAYKSSWVWNTQFKKKWKDWFADECYDQDPQAWAKNGKAEDGKQSTLERNLEALRKAAAVEGD